MLRGPATITFWADDLEVAKDWYTEVLGMEPYFEKPGYYEFRIGDYQAEIGLLDRRHAPAGEPAQPGGAIMHWHVDDIEGSFRRLLDLGATVHLPVTTQGRGSSRRRSSTRSATCSASCTTSTIWRFSADDALSSTRRRGRPGSRPTTPERAPGW